MNETRAQEKARLVARLRELDALDEKEGGYPKKCGYPLHDHGWSKRNKVGPFAALTMRKWFGLED